MTRLHSLVLVLLWCLLAVASGASVPLEREKDEEVVLKEPTAATTIYLEHALQPGKFTPRGTATLGGIRGDSITLNQNSLTNDELSQLNSLLKNGNQYQIRARSSNSQNWIVSHTKPCYLKSSSLADALRFHVNKKGQLYGLSYTTPLATEDACASNNNKDSISKTKFQTTSSVDLGIEAPKPGFEAPPPTPAEKKAEQVANQSFFSKYWMYIVPGLLIVVMNGITGGLAPPAEGEAGQQQQGQQQQGQRGAGAPIANRPAGPRR